MNPPDKSRLELALKASNEGIWKWNPKEQCIHYSELLVKILGFKTREKAPHLLQDIDKIYHPEDQESFKTILYQFLNTNDQETFGAQCRYLHPDNSLHWFRIRGAAERDSSGYPTLIAGSVIDITKRKRAEILLAEEKHLLNLLVESIPVNIYFKDKDSKFVMANTATAIKMGLTKSTDIIGKTDHDFFDVRHADKSLKDELTIMETKETLEGSLEKEIWDSEEDTWCITSKRPWLDRNGNIKGTFGVTNDVTEIVKTQDRLTEVAQIYKDRNDQYEEELNLASEVQQAILEKKIPPLPSRQSQCTNNKFTTSFDVIHIPMHGLAGDFYQAIPISETKMGILLCDVMGHGVRASLIVAMIRGLISKEQQSVAYPEQFLTSLNHGLCHILMKAGITMFSTAIYTVIDIESDSLTIASAGHPLPILKKASNYTLLDNPSHHLGTALGLVPDSEYQSSIIPIKQLDEIIFYTDGIYEVVNKKDEELGVNKLIKSINEESNDNTSSIHKLSCIAKNYSFENQFNDDVCLLSININH